MSILIAIGFTLIMDRVNKQNFSESFTMEIEKFTTKIEDKENPTDNLELENDDVNTKESIDDLEELDNSELGINCNCLCQINY